MKLPATIVPPARKGPRKAQPAGPHGDRRLRRQRDRSAARRAALNDQAAR